MKAAAHNSMPSLWLTGWAWLTVAAVLPLLFLGALVTTMKVGMADQRSVVSPLQAVREMLGGEQSLGWVVEHTHRLAGWLAGLCGIGLAIACWVGERGSRLRWLGLVGLTLIAAQGVLGIFRVQLNALWGTDLAWIHGIFAQVVFAALVAIALMLSPGFSWDRIPILSTRLSEASAGAGQDWNPIPRWKRWALACVALVLGQLVLGGMIRHQPNLVVARLHILGAFLVLASLLWLARLTLEQGLRRTAWVLLALVGLEIVLGVETGVHWMARFFRPQLMASTEPVMQMLTRTLHYVVGSLVFAATGAVALQAHATGASPQRQQGSAVADASSSEEAPGASPQRQQGIEVRSLQGGLA